MADSFVFVADSKEFCDFPLDNLEKFCYNLRTILILKQVKKDRDKKMGKYQTEQKKLLLSYMASHANEQFSAEQLTYILENACESTGKAPGKSTVYRLVAEMAEEGILRRFPKSEGRGWLYQYHRMAGCSGHLHLKCRGCGALLHLECGMSDELLAHIETAHGFKVDNSATVLYGLCKSCCHKDLTVSTLHPTERQSCPKHRHKSKSKNEGVTV